MRIETIALLVGALIGWALNAASEPDPYTCRTDTECERMFGEQGY